MQKNVLLVCSGNQFRSPMAEAMLRDMVERDRELSALGITVRSAGTSPFGGGPATDGAVRAMKEMGLDISSHESRPLDRATIDWADLILTMSAEHSSYIMEKVPEARDKVHLLAEYAGDQGDIAEPITAARPGEWVTWMKALLTGVLARLKSDTQGEA